MIYRGEKNILGILIDAVDYEATVDAVMEAAHKRRGFAVSALAVHGVMTGALHGEQKYRLNHFDFLVPDGQPVRWALNLLHGTSLREPVRGTKLMLTVCERAAQEGVAIYLYGSTEEVLLALRYNLRGMFRELRIVGVEASKFRRLSRQERDDVEMRIRNSGASIVFVGLGCPRQETWAYEFREVLSMPILAVGAAFPYLAGRIPEAPLWMQDRGLEWFYRLCTEPRRLWHRYLFLNPAYVFLVALQAIGLSRFATDGRNSSREYLPG